MDVDVSVVRVVVELVEGVAVNSVDVEVVVVNLELVDVTSVE